jgi:hypothetical protein
LIKLIKYCCTINLCLFEHQQTVHQCSISTFYYNKKVTTKVKSNSYITKKHVCFIKSLYAWAEVQKLFAYMLLLLLKTLFLHHYKTKTIVLSFFKRVLPKHNKTLLFFKMNFQPHSIRVVVYQRKRQKGLACSKKENKYKYTQKVVIIIQPNISNILFCTVP